MKRQRIIGVLIGIAALLALFVPSSASASVGTSGSCIWDNVHSWDAGIQDNGDPYTIPGGPGDDPGADPSGWWYVTTNKCADINIALNTRPQPAQVIGVRACYAGGGCDAWRFWGPGFNGWLELNDQQPIPDGTWFYVQMYGVDPYTTGWIAF
jgi:hypothetical protein